jgi:serine/threonine protein kinase
MDTGESGTTTQPCPDCGTPIDTTGSEPLAETICPGCGATVCVDCRFDNYRLLELLGTGGMGSVYKAEDTHLKRHVALKLLRKEIAAEPDSAERLQHEARLTAAINHPHVVKVFSFGRAHGQFYLVMELVPGWSLDELLQVQRHLSEAQTLEAGIQIARGLEAAQQAGLIHRDIKPANILFADAHTAKIVDFGLAVVGGDSAEAVGQIWGTPYYVAPERLNNEPEDFRSDIYSLGATLFHAVAGQPPFEGDTQSAVELRELKANPAQLRDLLPALSTRTAAAIHRMIEIDPARRQSSYRELIDELERAEASVAAPPSGPEPQPPRSWMQRLWPKPRR